LGQRVLTVDNGEGLPARLENPVNGVVFSMSRPMTLRELTSELSDAMGIPVRIGNVTGGVQTTGNNAAVNTAAADPSLNATVRISYSGPASALLRSIATRYGLDWEFRDGTVVFYRFETRVWNLYAPPFETTFTAAVGGQSAGQISSSSVGSGGSASASGGTTSGVTQSVKSEAKDLAVWKEVLDTIRSFLPPQASIVLSPSTATLSVTAPPSVMRQVDRYVRDQNERLARQMQVEVAIFNVTKTGSDDYGLDLAAAFRNTRSGAQFNLTSAPTGITNTVGSLTSGIINAPAGSAFSGITTLTNTVSALSTLGTTVQRDHGSYALRNGRPITVRAVDNIAYLDNQTLASSTSSSSQPASAKLSREDVGFTATFYPRIHSRGRIELSMIVSISESRGIRQVTSGTGSNQITLEDPQISRRDLPLDITLASGQSFVLSTIDRSRSSLNNNGVASPSFWALGGGQRASLSNTHIVVVVTPRVVESALDRSFFDAVSRSVD
jgi:type IVB pilus formation R64 PilN family outer membrane protein